MQFKILNMTEELKEEFKNDLSNKIRNSDIGFWVGDHLLKNCMMRYSQK